MSDFNNLPIGLRVQTQIPLDIKTYYLNEATLADLGTSNNLAFTYYDGLKVFCQHERTTYEWKQVPTGHENTGLITLDFTYPDDTICFGITYSLKKFNFFLVDTTGPQGLPGTNGRGITSISKINTTGLVDTYRITYTDSSTYTYTVTNGLNGTNGTNGIDASANNLQRIQTVTTNYNIVNADNNYTLFINNGTNNVTITIPDGLNNSLSIGFVQKGTGDVTFINSGSEVLFTPIGYKLKGQFYSVMLEKELSNGIWYLLGNTKL